MTGGYIWPVSRKIIIDSLPNIENEFNILIPVRNTAGKYPTNIVLAFSRSTYKSYNVANLNKFVAVYRVFGPPIEGDVN